jgi:hypothetical protein
MKIRFILVPNQLKEQRKREREKNPVLHSAAFLRQAGGVSENASPLISPAPLLVPTRENLLKIPSPPAPHRLFIGE